MRYEPDPLWPSDAMGFALPYNPPPDPDELHRQALARALAQVWQEQGEPETSSGSSTPAAPMSGTLRDRTQSISRTSTPSLWEATPNAFFRELMRGLGQALRGYAVRDTTLPVVGPLYEQIRRLPQMTPDERARIHQSINKSGLGEAQRAIIHNRLVQYAAGGPLPTLADLGADPDAMLSMQWSRSLAQSADRNFPVAPEHEEQFPVQAASLFGSAAEAAPFMLMGQFGMPAAAYYFGLKEAGAGDQRAEAAGATLPQRIEAAQRHFNLGALTSTVPFGLATRPIRPMLEGWEPWAFNKLANVSRAAGTAVPLGELHEYLSNRIDQAYDPQASYEFDPTRTLLNTIVAAGAGFLVPSPKSFTPREKMNKASVKAIREQLEGRSTGAPKEPFIPNRTYTDWDIIELEDLLRDAALTDGIIRRNTRTLEPEPDISMHHPMVRNGRDLSRRERFEHGDINIDDLVVPVIRSLHEELPIGIHTTGNVRPNRVWDEYFGRNPSPSDDQLYDQAREILARNTNVWRDARRWLEEDLYNRLRSPDSP